jgi:His-Xaa-Ser system protein HxsD
MPDYSSKGEKAMKDVSEVRVNPELFSIEAVLQAAYVLTEKAYVIVEGEVQRELRVVLKAKPGQDAGVLALELRNELINAQVYLIEAEREQKVSELIVSEALEGKDEEPSD